MPEGHTVHRLATAFADLFEGRVLRVTSPQGRFDAGAGLLDGTYLVDAEAHGKQLFLGFAPEAGTEAERWLRVHLGIYGSWSFATDGTVEVPHAIGAPRRRREEEPGDRWAPSPRESVRVRLRSDHAVADLTGPTACEVITPPEKTAVHARLGPDPLRPDADPDLFVAAVRSRRRAVGELLMDQSVIAGIGNIYRAEVLFRASLHPRREGRRVSEARLRAVWTDAVVLLRDGVDTGIISTVREAHRGSGGDPESDRWYVYHRTGRPCLVCAAPVTEAEMAGRRLFWCPRCQR